MPTAQREAAPKLRGVHCLVLGGGGFIGTNLCRALVLQGAEVHAFGRRQTYPEGLDGICWTQGDFADRAALARVVEGQDVLFHLVGGSIPESSNADPIADLIGSTLPSLHLLGICQAYGIRRIVFVSSGGTVYGIPSRIPIAEGAPTDPISAYGVSKLTVEKYLNLHRYLYNLDSVVLRVANPYGPFQNPTRRQGVVPALLRRVLDGQPVEVWGSGEVVRDFIYIDDVVDALIAAAVYDGPHHVFNVGSGVGRSILQIVADIGRVVARGPTDIIHKPGRTTDVPANVLDIALIRKELGWTPRVDWLDGLRATAAWLVRDQPVR